MNTKHTASATVTAFLIAVTSLAGLQAMLDVGTFEVFGNILESHVYGDIGSRTRYDYCTLLYRLPNCKTVLEHISIVSFQKVYYGLFQ